MGNLSEKEIEKQLQSALARRKAVEPQLECSKRDRAVALDRNVFALRDVSREPVITVRNNKPRASISEREEMEGQLQAAIAWRKAVELALECAKRDRTTALGERIARQKAQVDPTVIPLAVTCELITHPTVIKPEHEPLAPNDELVSLIGCVQPEKTYDPESNAC